MYQPGNRGHIEAALGKVRHLQGELGLKKQFSAFVGGSEWLNGTMRLNGAFWMAINNISEGSAGGVS